MRLIDVDELIKKAYSETEGMDKPYKDFGIVLEWLVNKMPTIEQKKGKWKITDAYPHNIYCSKCFVRYAQTHWTVWEDGSLPRSYCPNCGAEMEEGNDEN
jgi:hypothetical protein